MKHFFIFGVFLILVFFPLGGCYTLTHTVGTGGQMGNQVAGDRQWYILWGLVPLNHADGGAMAKAKGLTNNYTIQTQETFLDCIVNLLTSGFSVTGQSVGVFASTNEPSSSSTTGEQMPPVPADDPITMGNQALAAKDFKDALLDYQTAVNSNPNSAVAYQGLGDCYYYLGEKGLAIASYQEALVLNPNNIPLTHFVQSLQGSH